MTTWRARTRPAARAGGRRVVVHFGARTRGTVDFQVALSRPIAALPDTLAVPRVAVVGSVKHRGQLVVAAEQGIRLNVTAKEGVSAFDAVELGLRDPSARAFRLLRPVWSLALASEVIAPVLEVESLQVARVLDASVRHTQYLRCRVQHAGFKELLLEIPPGATGVAVTGPDIARAGPVDGASGVVSRGAQAQTFWPALSADGALRDGGPIGIVRGGGAGGREAARIPGRPCGPPGRIVGRGRGCAIAGD